MNKKTWWNLDHHVWHQLKNYSLEKKTVIVALSGGVDSLGLAASLIKVLGAEKIIIAHFHHGDKGESSYRDRALEFCHNFARDKKVPFLFKKWQGVELKSEAQMREKRYEFLIELQKNHPEHIVATGHHQNDVLETRLIRLIRGTGPQGLKAIQVYRAPFFRPFLDKSKNDIWLFLNKEGLKPLEDSSNSEDHFLRNWLRNEWLPQLEKKRPGSQESLGRSLQALVQAFPDEELQKSNEFILRSKFLALTESQQVGWLARVLLHSGQKDFTQFHLQEIRRRLLGSPKITSFKVAGCTWQVNAQQIQVQLLR